MSSFCKITWRFGTNRARQSDLHLIATALGIKKVKPRDHVDDIFNAPDFDELIHWLRHQPLLVHNEKLNFLMGACWHFA